MPTKKNAIARDDAAIIANADHFVVFMRAKGEKISETFKDIPDAYRRANELEAANPGKRALVSAVDGEGRQAPTARNDKPAPAKPAARAKAAKPKGKAKATKVKPAKAARKPSGPRAGSKVEKILKMLEKGATRAAICEAVDWPSLNLNQLAARKGIKLRKDADGIITAK